MASQVFTRSAITNWMQSFLNSNPINGTFTPTAPADGQVQIIAEGDDSDVSTTNLVPAAAATSVSSAVFFTGEMDFSGLPENILISSATLGIDASIELSATVNTDSQAAVYGIGGSDANATIAYELHLTFGDENHGWLCACEVPADSATDNDNNASAPSSAFANLSASVVVDTGDNVATVTFGVPVSKAVFMAFYSEMVFRFNCIFEAGYGNTKFTAGGSASVQGTTVNCTATAELDLEAHLNDFRIEVFYETDIEPVFELEVEQTGEAEFDGGGAEYYQIVQDISGIYVLVPGKRDDSWYDRAGGAGATTDVKIPDPYVSFGYVPED